MASFLGYMSAGLLGGAGQGISKNAETEMEQWKQKSEEMRQMSLMKLQQEYTTGERIAGQQFTSKENELGRKNQVDINNTNIQANMDAAEELQWNKEANAETAHGYAVTDAEQAQINELEQIEAKNKGALDVAKNKSKVKGADATKLKMANKYIDNNIKTNFLINAKNTPDLQQSMDQFYVTNSITGAKELDVNKVIASLPEEERQRIKDVKSMTETLMSDYKYEPQEAVDFAERKVASDIVKKNQAVAEKKYGMTAKDMNDILKMKPTPGNVNLILNNPDEAMQSNTLKFIQENRPSFYKLLMEQQEKKKDDTKFGNVNIRPNAPVGDPSNPQKDIFSEGNVTMVDPSTSVNIRNAPPQNGSSIFTKPLPKTPPYKQNTQGILDGSVMSRY